MFGGYSETKIKPLLKMAVSRFNIASNKKTALMKQQMRAIAKLLEEDPPKEEKARIRAEALIRDDGTIEAYEILQLSCELLSERIKLISSSKYCPDDLKSTIATLMWASTRVDIKELIDVRKQFRSKYGKKFDTDAMNNTGGILNERIVAKLSVQPPTAYLVQTYLEKIADQFNVEWEPAIKVTANNMAEPMPAPLGYSVQVAPGTGLAPAAEAYPVNGNDMGGNGSSYTRGSVATSGSAPMAPAAAAAMGGSTVGGHQSDDVSELGTTSASILSSMRGNFKDDRDDNDDSNGGGGGGAVAEPDIPVAQVMPASTPAASMGIADIYIPAAPTKTDTLVIPAAPGARSSRTNKNDDDDFDDLQSRFANLKR